MGTRRHGNGGLHRFAALALGLAIYGPSESRSAEPEAFTADATITVDFAVPTRDGKRLTGFINSPFPDTEEHRYLVEEIEPAFNRAGPTLLLEYDDVVGFGVDFPMLNVATQVGWELPADGELQNDLKNPHLYLDEYIEYLENLSDYVISKGFDQELVYSFWNEGNRVQEFEGEPEDFLATFTTFHDTLRYELGDSIMISGPSYGYFDTGIRDDDDDVLLTAFMDNALDNGLRVDYMGLHLFPRVGIDFEETPARLDRYWEKFGPDSIYAPVGIRGFVIDESTNDDDHLIPATSFAWLHMLDRDDVHRASRGGWDDFETVCENRDIEDDSCLELYGPEVFSDNSWNHSLNATLTHNEFDPTIEIGPRATWWPYKYYADGRTSRVASSSDDEYVVSIASTESGEPGKAQAVVSYFGKNTLRDTDPTEVFKDIAVTFDNVSAAIDLSAASSVRVDIERIPYDGDGLEIVAAPDLLAHGLVLPVDADDRVTVELPAVWVHELYVVKIYALADPADEPELSVTPPDLRIEVYEGNPESVEAFTISNAGGGVLDWTISEIGDSGRFSFEPAGGTLTWGQSIEVIVTVDTLGIPDGEYLNSIEVTAVVGIEAEPEIVPVDLVILDNEFPIAFDSTHTMKEDELLAFEVVYDDPDLAPGPFDVVVVTPPFGGVATEESLGQFQYTPNPGFVGEDTLIWVANDGAANSNEAVVTITVEGIPEVAADVTGLDWTIYAGEPEVSSTIVVTNVGLGTLNWTAETIPTELTFVAEPPSGVLEPGASAAITLSKDTALAPAGTYVASLGILDTEARNHPFELPLSLEVVDHAKPTAFDQDLLTSEGFALPIVLDYTDDGIPGIYTFTIVSQPASGSLVETAPGQYVYTPSVGYTGPDSFTWSVHDGALDSRVATASIGVNQIPIADDQSVSTLEDTDLNIQLSYSDDGLPGPHTVTIVSPPVHGTLVEFALGQYIYTPDAGFYGADSFVWRVNDGLIDSEPAVISIDVAGVAAVETDRSEIVWTFYRGEPSATESITLSNVGGADLVWDAQTLPETDILSVAPASGVLAPGQSIELLVTADLANLSDGVFELDLGLLDPAEKHYPSKVPVILTLLANDDPLASNVQVLTSEEVPISIDLDLVDDGIPGAPTFMITAPPLHGTLVEEAPGRYRYTSEAGFVGTDTFSWTANDGLLESNEATVSVGVNQIPVADDVSVSTLEDTPVNVQLSYSDDGLPGPYAVAVVAGPSNGSLVEFELGKYTYTPDEGFVGTDTFRFAVDDGLIFSEEATVTIDVVGVAEITTDKSEFVWTFVQGSDPLSTTLQVRNTGGGVLDWSIASDPDTLPLAFEPAAGLLDPGDTTTVTITVSAGPAPVGVYEASIAVLDPEAVNGPFVIPVTLTVVDALAPDP